MVWPFKKPKVEVKVKEKPDHPALQSIVNKTKAGELVWSLQVSYGWTYYKAQLKEDNEIYVYSIYSGGYGCGLGTEEEILEMVPDAPQTQLEELFWLAHENYNSTPERQEQIKEQERMRQQQEAARRKIQGILESV
jgi:hypothetical protein